jgi:hypothetical protein
MRIGAICWSTNRGLGIQSREFHRHMNPDRVMILNAGPSEFDAHSSQFGSDALHVSIGADHRVPERPVREWLKGLDVVFAAESLPDWRMADWARDVGVATVVQTNPEFFKHWADPRMPHPTMWWNPTTWRQGLLPVGTVHVPVPVAMDRFSSRSVKDPDGRLRVLHVGGRQAIYDRNGTQIVLQSCVFMENRVDVVITSQDGRVHAPMQRGHGVRVQIREGNIENYWDLYRGFDVLVMPRRYGGLSLPVQEAMAAGLVVVMSDCSPNRDWPIMPVPVVDWSRARMPGGEIDLAAVSARSLGAAIDRLAADQATLTEFQECSVWWARKHSWEALKPVYLERLSEAIELARC